MSFLHFLGKFFWGIVLGILLGLIGFFFFVRMTKMQDGKSNVITQSSPTNTPQPKPSYTYGAWISWWDEKRAIESLTEITTLTNISPFWYKLTDTGVLVEIPTQYKNEIRLIAKQKSIAITPTLVNEFVSKRVTALFNSLDNQKNLAHLLISDAAKYGYTGFDLDFEYLDQQEETRLTQFIVFLSQALTENKLTLTVTVHARQGIQKDWDKAKTYNWKAIAPWVSAIRIMAYDFHNSESKSGPITPDNDLIGVINYAKQQIPAHKIVIALPNYGYDWGPTKVTSIVFSDIASLLPKHVSPRRDPDSGELSFTYNSPSHTVWYSDSQSVLSKIDIAKKYDITQFVFWVLGGEDKSLWNQLN